MLIEDQINALLAKAEPLRQADEEDQGELPAIVDRINQLRALQAAGRVALEDAIAERDEAEFRAVAEEVNKRRPGRPRKDQAA